MTCWSAYQLANLLDLWTFAGHCTRLATPLGLNHLHAWDFSANRTGPLAEDWGTRIRRVQRRELLGPAKDLEEHWERGVTFWMVFTIDRFASAITDLCTSLDESECHSSSISGSWLSRAGADESAQTPTFFSQRTLRLTCRVWRPR